LCAVYWHFMVLLWLVLFALLTSGGGDLLPPCRSLAGSRAGQMTEPAVTEPRDPLIPPQGWHGIAADWASDQRAFKNVSWGKVMMWIFLLSDTFIFSCFLLSYMTVRISTQATW